MLEGDPRSILHAMKCYTNGTPPMKQPLFFSDPMLTLSPVRSTQKGPYIGAACYVRQELEGLGEAIKEEDAVPELYSLLHKARCWRLRKHRDVPKLAELGAFQKITGKCLISVRKKWILGDLQFGFIHIYHSPAPPSVYIERIVRSP